MWCKQRKNIYILTSKAKEGWKMSTEIFLWNFGLNQNVPLNCSSSCSEQPMLLVTGIKEKHLLKITCQGKVDYIWHPLALRQPMPTWEFVKVFSLVSINVICQHRDASDIKQRKGQDLFLKFLIKISVKQSTVNVIILILSTYFFLTSLQRWIMKIKWLMPYQCV